MGELRTEGTGNHRVRQLKRFAGNVALVVLMTQIAIPLAGQHRIKSVSLEQGVTQVAVDRPGDVYLTLRNGKLMRVDADGTVTPVYSITKAPTLFDPRDGSRLFAYQREEQSYAFFSISQSVTAQPVDSAFAIAPWLVCSSGDHNLWVADAADNTLRKINPSASAVVAEINFGSDVGAITFMREYQGFLFVLHPTRGIVIFSSMGRELRTVAKPGTPYFNFLGEELYYPENDHLVFFNLFNAETRSMKLPRQATFTLITDARIFFVSGNTVEIYMTPH